MLALIAALLFAIAWILHLIGGAGKLVEDFWLGGLIFVALHMAFGWPWPWRRPAP